MLIGRRARRLRFDERRVAQSPQAGAARVPEPVEQRAVDGVGGFLGAPVAAAPGAGSWHRYRLDVNGSRASAWVDGAVVAAGADVAFAGGSGFAAIALTRFTA
jgi:hypothetical protein